MAYAPLYMQKHQHKHFSVSLNKDEHCPFKQIKLYRKKELQMLKIMLYNKQIILLK